MAGEHEETFTEAPVVEVALSVQFESLNKMRAVHLGLLWQEFRSAGFSKSEEHPPIEPIRESFQGPAAPSIRLKLEMFEKPPVPRIWYVNSDGSELIQVQPDRFVRNWRKTESNDYPRYKHVRREFINNYKTFENFVEQEELGSLNAVQCEVTYVNHVHLDSIGFEHSNAHKILKPWSGEYSDDFLSYPEDVTISARHVILKDEKKIGRLHIKLAPAFTRDKGEPIFILTMVARGTPLSTNLNGILEFFDLGRLWIVKGFKSVTTNEMHKNWGLVSNGGS